MHLQKQKPSTKQCLLITPAHSIDMTEMKMTPVLPELGFRHGRMKEEAEFDIKVEIH